MYFYSETEVGPVTKQLYDELVGIQFGDKEAPEGWIQVVEINHLKKINKKGKNPHHTDSFLFS